MQTPPNLLRVALQSIRDAVVTTDSSARIRSLNRAAEEMTGWTDGEACGKLVEEVVNLRQYGTDDPHPNPAYAALREKRKIEHTGDTLLVGKDGRRLGVHITAAPIEDALPGLQDDPAGESGGCLLVFYDASESQRLAENMSYQAQHDSLTGLPNRILLVDRLEQGTRHSDRSSDQLAVVFVDLDDFHQVNETYGHAVADRLLKEVAYRLTGSLRESDTVCRLGGDEFVLLLHGVKSLSNVHALAVKLLQEIGRTFLFGEHAIQITCSIGISIYPRNATDAGTLMRLADGAMHKAKQNGRNQFLFFTPDSVDTAGSDLEIAASIFDPPV